MPPQLLPGGAAGRASVGGGMTRVSLLFVRDDEPALIRPPPSPIARLHQPLRDPSALVRVLRLSFLLLPF